MKLIRVNADGTQTASGDPPLYVTPVPQEVLDSINRQRNSPEEDARVIAMVNKMAADEVRLRHAPVGGEDAYFAAMKREGR